MARRLTCSSFHTNAPLSLPSKLVAATLDLACTLSTSLIVFRLLTNRPHDLKTMAHAAANGSLDSLRALSAAVPRMSNEDRLLLLPAFYAALDIPDIPTIEAMTTESFPTSSFHRVVLAVGVVSNIPGIHPLALNDLWMRLWVGVQLLDFATQLIPEAFSNAGIGPVNFFCMIERFLYEDGGGPINCTTGVWTLVGKSWSAMLQREDVFGDMAFNKLCRFLARAAITYTNVEEVIVGAGGITELAMIIVQHIKLTKFSIATLADSIYLHSVVRFLSCTDTSLRSGLLRCGIVPALTGAISILGSSQQDVKGVTRTGLLHSALVILMEAVTLWKESTPRQSVYHWLRQSLKAGLLGTLMDISYRFFDGKVVTAVEDFLTKVLPASMMDPIALKQVLDQYGPFREAIHSTELQRAILCLPWKNFHELVVQRSGVVARFENAVPMRACDNGSCDVIKTKKLMNRCSNCQTNYYCSRLCQIQDWRAGSHREHCRILRASKYAEPFSSRQLSFMRAVLHADYLSRRFEIICRQTNHMIDKPGADFYTMFYYSNDNVEVDVRKIGEYPKGDCNDWRIDWGYHARLKRQSEGRMDLHLMVIARPGGGSEARMFSKRSFNAEIAIGQREIAERAQRPAVHELEALILALCEIEEECIH
ncbi:MYND-type domain-containing protein [Mycena venus]|uniref:MYND-type domain-containing protein n=1 Tax=Mycena venus TaxID=2733690 RepID=A0A8H7CQL4_9AGAR|nr:MYND-type domain-containing protein [Mycena venus]